MVQNDNNTACMFCERKFSGRSALNQHLYPNVWYFQRNINNVHNQEKGLEHKICERKIPEKN